MKKLYSLITHFFTRSFRYKRYIAASEKDILAVNFKYETVLNQLQEYDSGKNKSINPSAEIKALQNYFKERNQDSDSQ